MARVRELTSGWARVGFITWVAVLLAEIAVAISSRTVGKPPWWLGPSVDPAPIVFAAVPAILIIVPGVLFGLAHARSPHVALVCACGLFIVGVVDFGRTPGVALVQCAIAISALLSSLSTNAGLFTRD